MPISEIGFKNALNEITYNLIKHLQIGGIYAQ